MRSAHTLKLRLRSTTAAAAMRLDDMFGASDSTLRWLIELSVIES